MFDEFKQFIMRGNVLDLAIGIIIGTAFKDIVNSLVNDIIMPPIGLALGGVDFSNIFITLKEASGAVPAVTINIGVFINVIIEFLIIAFAVFMVIRAANNMMKRFEKAEEPTAEAPAEPTSEEKLLAAIQELTAAIKSQKS